MTLASTSDGGRGGYFTIDADGRGGATHIVIPSAPIDHKLRLRVNTNNAPLHIEVPKTFEGVFEAFSSIDDPPLVRYNRSETDPTGMGRNRTVRWRRHRPDGGVGSVFWGSNSVDRGAYINAATGDSSLTLDL